MAAPPHLTPSSNRPKVFITQIPNRRDDATGLMKPMFDVQPAAEHGDLQHPIMPPSFSLFQTADMVKALRGALWDYSFARGDAVIATGDPAIIFACGAVLSEQHRKLRLLKWERSVSRYVPVEIAL